MYDLSGADSDGEWVEIYNEGPTTVEIVTGSGNGSWRFSDTSPHILTLSGGSAQIGSGKYAIIAKNPTRFSTDWPNFAGTLFLSSIALPNTQGTLSITDGSGQVVDTISYNSEMGANGDGNTLQKVGSSLSPAPPTPGFSNSVSSIIAEEQVQNTASVSSPSTSPGTNFNAQEFSITVIGDKIVPVGLMGRFSTTLSPKDYVGQPEYTWSFGDGGSYTGKSVVHMYDYVGKYVVMAKAVANGVVATGKMVVTVVPLEVLISNIVLGNNGYIELQNLGKIELDLSGFVLESGKRAYALPSGFVILPNSSIKIPARISGFITLDSNRVSLIKANSNLSVSDYIYEQEVLLSEVGKESLEFLQEIEDNKSAQLAQISLGLEAVKSRIVNIKVETEPVSVDKISEPKPALISENNNSNIDVIVIPRQTSSWFTRLLSAPRVLISAIIASI